jgi:flagellar protein FliS
METQYMGIEAYNQQSAVSDDPYALILKLYEGVIKYLSFVKSAIQDENIEAKFTYINKAIAIFDELRNVLDFDGGEVAYYLDGLYLYQIETLFAAGVDDNTNSINQVIKVTQGLIDAWKDETGL